MTFLIISIILNSFVGVIFKHFDHYKIEVFSTIVLNYWICVVTGSIFAGNFPIRTETLQLDWFPWALLIGILFISIFYVIAISSIKVGVTITQAANKLSLAIPVIFSILLYNEELSLVKIAGISLAIIAVLLVTSKNKKQALKPVYLLLPIALFIGSGIIDTVMKYTEQKYFSTNAQVNHWLITCFFIAACIGTLSLIIQLLRGKIKLGIREVAAAFLLGIPNYFSIYFLMKALQFKGLSSSAIIPINNIGILAVVTLYGLFIFREKLSRKNMIGLALSVISILLIYYGDL